MTHPNKSCPVCERRIGGLWRAGVCDECGGSGRDEHDEDCSNCQGTGYPVCCRCEGTGVDLHPLLSHQYPKYLKDADAIADYVAAHSTDEVDAELMQEFFRDTHAVLREIRLDDLRPGDPDHNIADKRKEARYLKMNLDTMPPILVEDNEIQDGNHRYRVLLRAKRSTAWCYDVVEGTPPREF